jgi:hypothetical protein
MHANKEYDSHAYNFIGGGTNIVALLLIESKISIGLKLVHVRGIGRMDNRGCFFV